jgi:glycosyltransferase involved in cell wall biosynthesis
MKIAFIGQKGIPASSGGVERHVEEIAVRMAKIGHDIYVYNRPNYANLNIKSYGGVNLISLSTIPTKHFDAISHTFRAIISASYQNYDLVHFHSIGPSFLIWLFKLLNPTVPVVATYHSRDYFHQKWGIFAKAFLFCGEIVLCRLADQTIAVSRSIKDYLEKRYKIEVSYLPNGTNPSCYVGIKQIKRWGLEKEGYILAVSRLIPHKGLHYLIKAYEKLKTDKKLVIVGDGFFTDKYRLYLEKISQANKNIIFTGKQHGQILEELYANASVFVQPSEYEGLSLTLLEAMSYGLPILISDIKENTDVAGSTAFIFKNKDSDDLALRLEYILQNRYEADVMGLRAKKLVLSEFSWDNIVENLNTLYFSVFCKKKKKKYSWPVKMASKFAHLWI